MKTVSDMRGHPRFDEIREKALQAGSDSLDVFGGQFAGGYHMQQNVDEIAALVCFLLNRCKPIGLYGEIGTAAGGTLRFIHENVGFNAAFIIDNGCHPKHHPHFPVNTADFRNRIEVKYSDSRNPELPAFLGSHLGDHTFDVIFIDADHRYEWVKSDTDLILPHCRPDTLLVFHDTVSCEGVTRFFNQLTQVANFVGESKPQGIGVALAGA